MFALFVQFKIEPEMNHHGWIQAVSGLKETSSPGVESFGFSGG